MSTVLGIRPLTQKGERCVGVTFGLRRRPECTSSLSRGANSSSGRKRLTGSSYLGKSCSARKHVLRAGILAVTLAAVLWTLGCAQPAAPAPTATTAPSKPAAPATAAPAAPAATAAPTAAPAAKPAATAASAPTSAPAAKPATLTKVTIAGTGFGSTYTLQAMKNAGIDKKYGLDIELLSLNPSDGQAAVLAGKVDLATIPPLTVAQAKIEGHDVVSFAPNMFNHASIVVPPGSSIKRFEDLKGKRIGTLSVATSVYRTMQMLARERGLDWEKDFQLQISASMPVVTGLLQQKQLDMATLTEPFTSKSIVAGYGVELASVNEMWKEKHGVSALAVLLTAKGDWFAKNRDVAKRLLQAQIEGGAVAATANETRAQRKFLQLDEDNDLNEAVKRFPSFFSVSWDQKVIDDLYAMANVATELGALTGPLKDKIYVIP